MDRFKLNLLEQSKQEKIGLIFSISDLHKFYIEILNDGQATSLSINDNLQMFNSMADAKQIVIQNGCTLVYLCLDNTYDECGSASNMDRFSYMPVTRKTA